MSGFRFSRVARGVLPAILSTSLVICSAADELPTRSAAASSSLYLKVQLDHPLKLSKLKPGAIVQGKLARHVYSGDRELFPAESSVRLTVDHLEKRRRTPNDHWPWVVKAFTSRQEKYPVFQMAVISGVHAEIALQVSLVSVSRRREVFAQAKRKQTGRHAEETGGIEVGKAGGMYASRNMAAPMLVLEASSAESEKPASDGTERGASSDEPDLPVVETLPAGTAFKILLLGDVSASKSKPGDMIQARLLEPAFLNSRLALPAGTLFEGKVVKQTPPRWGSRSGSLFLTFDGLTLPGGNFIPIAASLRGAELDRGSHTRIDAEGQFRGERPGKAWMAINLGVTAGLAKEVDDGTQLIVEALISTATDASTAGTARIVASCISGIFMVTRHGRDVVLPRFTEMDIVLDRPLSVTKSSAFVPSAAILRGN